jgi:hypothetical protein
MTTLKRDQQMSAAAKKAERDRDAAQALRDYDAEKRAAQANMMRLRALRLAEERTKERADAQAPAPRRSRKKT